MSQTKSSPARVVVGVDGSQSSLGALDWAVEQCVRSGAALDIVTAWDWPKSYGWAMPLPEGYQPAADAERLLGECADGVRRDHPTLEVTTTSTEGYPATVLVEASRGASLLVVGSRGHGQFAGILLGSVSEQCASHAHCPVLIYRDSGE